MTSRTVSNLRVCILSEFFYPDSNSGTGKAVTDIAHHLSHESGIEVDVICGARSYLSGERMPPSDSLGSVNIRRVSYPDWNRSGVAKRSLCNIVLALKAAWKMMFLPKYDVILVTSAPPFMPMAAYIINKLRRTPYAYLVYDLEPDRACRLGAVGNESLPTKMLRKAHGKWMQASSKVVTIGRCMKKLVQDVYSIAEDSIEVVPVGVDENSIRYVNYPVTSPNEKTRLRIVYSGNLGRYHDFDTLLNCAKKLSPSDFEFLIVGTGAKRPHVDERLQSENIPCVRVLSPLPFEEYERLLQSADACFVTMEKGIEGTCVPSKFYSIMAAGRPTLAVASPESELAMALEEHACGLVVPPANEEALMNALQKMLTSPEMLVDMAKNARTAFLANYTVSDTVGRLGEILHAIAGNNRVRPTVVLPSTRVTAQSRMDEAVRLAQAKPVENLKGR